MLENLSKVLHTGTRREKDHNFRWPLFMDEMDQLTQLFLWFTDLNRGARMIDGCAREEAKRCTM